MSVFKKGALNQLKQKENTEKKYNVLLVDDEEMNLRSLSQILEGKYNIFTAPDGLQALEIIKKHKIEIILSDQRMPNMTGTELFKNVMESSPETIRIIITAYTDINSVLNAINQGNVYKFLTKPIEPEDLKITVKRALEVYELQKNNEHLLQELRNLNTDLEKKVEERTHKLVETNQFQKDLVETIIHDLKNPLSNIIMFSRNIAEREQILEKAKNTSELINTSGKQLLEMVEKLLEISFIENESIKPEMERINLARELEDLVAHFSESAKNKEIKLELINNLDNAYIFSDRILFRRIINNLLSNALKFSDFNKSVIMTLVRKEKDLLISVKDEGPGLSEKDQGGIFQKFTKLTAQPTDGEYSTGLGLSIVKNLTEILKGEIWYENNVPSGSCFCLKFKEFRENKDITNNI